MQWNPHLVPALLTSDLSHAVNSDIDEQDEQIKVTKTESLEPIAPALQVPIVYINGVDPEDQQSECSLGTYRTKTTVTKSESGLERINDLEKSQHQIIHEIGLMKTIILQISERNQNHSGNKSIAF